MLIKSHLRDVATALRLSAVVMRRIWLNFVWAFGYNLIGIPLAAGVLYPVWKIHLPPMFAGATMSLSSILVVCSSLHLKCFAPPKLPIVGGARSVSRCERHLSYVDHILGLGVCWEVLIRISCGVEPRRAAAGRAPLAFNTARAPA